MTYHRALSLTVLIAILLLPACDRSKVDAVLASHGITDPVVAEQVHATLSAQLVPSDAALARLRQCEATGNYRAVSKSGKYRGAYQFDRKTWVSVGGAGSDPAAASPAEQDAAARTLYAQRGRTPWPVCGKRL